MKDVSLTVRKRKDSKKYQAIISIKQGKQWKQVESQGGFDTKIMATNWAVPRLAIWQKKVVNDYEKMTIGQLKEIYIEDLSKRVKESTLINATSFLKLCNKFDDLTLDQVTPYQYREYKKDLPYSYTERMHAFYNFLRNDLEIKVKNPYKAIYVPSDKEKVVPYKTYTKMLEAIGNDDCRMACKIIYNAGTRIAEVAGLQISDITKNHIVINKQLNHTTKKMSTVKSKNSNREIPITDDFYKELRTFINSKPTIRMDQRIFPQNDPSNALSKARRYYLNDTEFQGITFHDLRHTYITNLVISGLDLLTVAYLAGDDLNTITKTYIHLTKENYNKAKEFIKNQNIVNIWRIFDARKKQTPNPLKSTHKKILSPIFL